MRGWVGAVLHIVYGSYAGLRNVHAMHANVPLLPEAQREGEAGLTTGAVFLKAPPSGNAAMKWS